MAPRNDMVDFGEDPCDEGNEGAQDATRGDGVGGKGKMVKRDPHIKWMWVSTSKLGNVSRQGKS